MKWIKKVIIIASPFLIIAILLLGLYISRTETSVVKSPTGNYYIKMYWTDVGGWGWRG